MRINNLFSLLTILLAFAVFSFISPQSIQAQSFFKVTAADDRPSSGGSGGSDSDDTIFIVAGLAAAGVIGYIIYKRFGESEEEEKGEDSEASIQNILDTEKNKFANKVKQVNDEIPVNIYLSVQKPTNTIPDRMYSVGLSFRF